MGNFLYGKIRIPNTAMREREQFDLAFQEVSRDKNSILNKIAKSSKNTQGRVVSAGVLLEGLGATNIYLGQSINPLLYLSGLVLFGAGFALHSEPITYKLLDKLSGHDPSRFAYSLAELEISKLQKSGKREPSSKEEVELFLKKIFYLPPVGGKITLEENSLRPTHLFPALTTDEKVEEIIKFRQNKELGEAYVHQLTVQGRLPDEFKHAGLALITNSTFRSDWTKPFYEAPWGKVSPLIHDGGNVSTINPFWTVKGRTDLIQRVATVYDPELEDMERHASTPQLVTELSSEVLDNAVLEQEEKRRLILEINFYQRAAFALHLKTGTVPNVVPPDVARKGRETWEDFVKSMKSILSNYGGENIFKQRWFTRVPRPVPGIGGLRYEANYKPIQEALMSLEEIKSKNPSMRYDVNLLMNKTISSIDNAIGI